MQDDGCSDDFILPEDAFDIINAYALAFVRERLWGDPPVASQLADASILREELVLLRHVQI